MQCEKGEVLSSVVDSILYYYMDGVFRLQHHGEDRQPRRRHLQYSTITSQKKKKLPVLVLLAQRLRKVGAFRSTRSLPAECGQTTSAAMESGAISRRLRDLSTPPLVAYFQQTTTIIALYICFFIAFASLHFLRLNTAFLQYAYFVSLSTITSILSNFVFVLSSSDSSKLVMKSSDINTYSFLSISKGRSYL